MKTVWYLILLVSLVAGSEDVAEEASMPEVATDEPEVTLMEPVELQKDPAPAELLPDEIEEVVEENAILHEEAVVGNDTAPSGADNATVPVDPGPTEAEIAAAKKAAARRIICKKLATGGDEESNIVLESVANDGNATDAPDQENNLALDEHEKIDPPSLEVLPHLDEEAVLPPPPKVSMANGTHFLHILSEQFDSNVTNRSVPAQCHLALFYASWCPFSARAAPHFNALARVFPDVDMIAVDSYKHYGLNSQFGVLSFPTLMLFHNGRAMYKFNGTEFEVGYFADYLVAHTNLEKALKPEVLQEDQLGPVPTEPTTVTDYYLYVSWAFVILVCLGQFGKSAYCQRIIEALRNNWREAEMHEHID